MSKWLNCNQDLITHYITKDMEDAVSEECGDVIDTLGYNLFGLSE